MSQEKKMDTVVQVSDNKTKTTTKEYMDFYTQKFTKKEFMDAFNHAVKSVQDTKKQNVVDKLSAIRTAINIGQNMESEPAPNYIETDCKELETLKMREKLHKSILHNSKWLEK